MTGAQRVVVVGGVAGGMSFAARARRLSEAASIVVLERDGYVSFANCGLPYHLGGEIPDRSSLLLHTPETLAASLALDVRTGHEVLAVDRAARTVRVRRRSDGSEYDERYDALVLSTGATPIVPPVPGVDLPQVRVLRTLPDVDALRALVDGGARRAVVAGAGFIGLEVAEALRHRGLDVTVADLADQVLPPLDPEMARSVEQALVDGGVAVRTSTSVTAVEPAPQGVSVHLSDGTTQPADLVLLSVGVRPESSLAAAAGLALGERGAVRVDEHLLTSDPHVYAVGDAVEVVDAVTGAPAVVPLAGPANRQGRAAANHLFGRTGGRAPSSGRRSSGSSTPSPRRPGAARSRCGRPGSPTTSSTCTPATTPATSPARGPCTSSSSSPPTDGCSAPRPPAARVSTSGSTSSRRRSGRA